MHAPSSGMIPHIAFFTHLDEGSDPLFGNPLSHWFVALVVALIVMVIFQLIFRLILNRMAHISAKTDNRFDDVIVDAMKATHSWFWIIVALFLGSQFLDLGKATKTVQHLLAITTFLQAGFWVVALLESGLNQWHDARNKDKALLSVMALFRYVGQVLIWCIVALLILDNFGVKVASLLAGLGVGGIAVALAVQRLLSDLLASFSIVLDKPFEIGDTIDVGSMIGTVEFIGLKTTRVRAASGEQLIISNSDILNSRIRNLKRMQERRNVLNIGITYETDPQLVAQVPTWVREVIETQPSLRFDRTHLQKFGDSALIFEVIYWVTNPDMNVHMDTQQAVLLGILSKFNAEGVEFAYPTQVNLLRGNAKDVKA